MANYQVYFRVNGGEWNGSPTADPVANVGGADLSSMFGDIMFPTVQGTGDGIVVCNFGASAFIGSVPLGYTPGWPRAGGGWTTLDPTKAYGSGGNLSGGDLTVQFETVPGMVQAVDGYNTGLYYFELTNGGTDIFSGDQGGGVGQNFASGGDINYWFSGAGAGGAFNSTSNSGGALVKGGTPYTSPAWQAAIAALGSTLVASAGLFASGDVIGVAVYLFVVPIPTGLTISSPSLTSLTAAWTPGAGTPGDSTFTLQYRATGGGGWTQISGISGDSQIVTGLTPGTEYDFEVETIWLGNPSGFTGTANGWTLPSMPTGLSTGSPTTTAITASWSAGSGGAPSSYTLQWRATGTTPWTQVAGISGMSQAVSGLTPETDYDFEVQAVNPSGSSAFTATATGWTLPSVPVDLAVGSPTAASLTATWAAGAGGAPLSYTLQYRATGTSSWTQISGVAGLSQMAAGLAPETEYDIQVEAVGTAGPSGFTATVTGWTLPSVPIDLTVIDPPGSLWIQWAPGMGPLPLSYTLQYRVTGTSPWTQITGILDVAQIVTGLLVAVSYDFQVEAIGSGGPSGFTATVTGMRANLFVTIALPKSLGRWRGACGINWQGLALVGDAFSNVVGLSDFNAFTEYGQPMQFLVTTPPLHEDRKRLFMPRFEIEVQAGQGMAAGGAPQMMLDISKDGGMTWGPLSRGRSMGNVGEYIKRLRWINLGHSRTWIFRLRCTDPVRRAVIGVYHSGYKGLG